MQLTKNFSLSELVKSQTATRLDIDNTPSSEVIDNLRTLAENILQPIRDYYETSVRVSSGYRSPELNAAIGGSRTSDHTRGRAADIEISGVANADLAKHIVDNYEFTQVILEFYTPGIPDSGWVHVSYDPNNLKCQALTAVKENGRTVYKPGLIA